MINFEILPLLNTKVFSILDVSQYEDIPINPRITLKFPNFKKLHNSTYRTGDISYYSTKDLKYSDCAEEFPDGIYEVTINPNNSPFTKKIFRTINLQLKLKDLIANSDLFDNKVIDNIDKIYVYLKGAEFTVCQDENLAKEYYNLADNLLKC